MFKATVETVPSPSAKRTSEGVSKEVVLYTNDIGDDILYPSYE